MISNPATFFVNGCDEKHFTYEGGTALYHFSPYDNKLSATLECNVIFFADSEAHALDVLRRLFLFIAECDTEYIRSKDGRDDHGFIGQRKRRAATLKCYLEKIKSGDLKVSLAPMNQFYVVGWASNDSLSV